MRKIYTYLNTVGLILSFLFSLTTAKALERTKENSSQEMKEDHTSHKESQDPSINVEVLPLKDIKKGKSQTVKIKLTSLKDNKAILLSDLKEVHTKKIHILIFDQTLNDYQHVHPEPTKEGGVYQFDWKPRTEGFYRLWVNVVPVKTEEEEYIKSDLAFIKGSKKEVNQKLSQKEKVGDNWYSLSFDTIDLKKDQPALGTVKILDAQGHDFKKLEPVMGAFAHIVAINEDFETIAHVHPMGEEPSSEKERGGPELMFHLEPKKSGYYKIWLQVRLNGKDVYVPFGVNVLS